MKKETKTVKLVGALIWGAFWVAVSLAFLLNL